MLRTRIGMCAALCIAIQSVSADDPVAALRATYPEVRFHNAGRNFKYFYGTRMTTGETEAQAAAAFLAQHGAAFGGPVHASGPSAGQPEVREVWNMPSRDGRFVAFAYTQKIRGKEVDGSVIRIRVKRGEVARVDYAAARLAGEPTAGSESPAVSSEMAVLTMHALSGIEGLIVEEPPEVVVLRGVRARPDAWCWRVRTRERGDSGPFSKRRTYYVDTLVPRILHLREHFWANEPPTTGTVEGSGLEAAAPWHPYGGPLANLVSHRIPYLRVVGATGLTGSEVVEYTSTNASGEFVLSSGSSGQVISIQTSVAPASQQWYGIDIVTSEMPPYLLAASTSETVGEHVPLVLANSNLSEEERVAQVTAIVGANRSRDFYLQYVGSFGHTVVVRPNWTAAIGSCGSASGVGSYGIGFAPSSPGFRRNCATYSGVAHEFGHLALNTLAPELGDQRGFHEGFADSYATLVNDHSVQGPAQFQNGNNLRDDPTIVDCHYPLPNGDCGCAAFHSTGQLLAGVWCWIRTKHKDYYGNSTGLEHARTIFGQWALITVGGDEECESAHPGTLVEVLSLFDSETLEDAPKIEMVAASFAEHNICPNGPCDE